MEEPHEDAPFNLRYIVMELVPDKLFQLTVTRTGEALDTADNWTAATSETDCGNN